MREPTSNLARRRIAKRSEGQAMTEFLIMGAWNFPHQPHRPIACRRVSRSRQITGRHSDNLGTATRGP
jgi:hypothetical protein